jgi:hypothetical protein
MKNEALETHVVRSVNVLAVPRPRGGRVFQAVNGEFWGASHLQEPRGATGPEGDCLAALRELDGLERFSHADSSDLGRRETLEVTFKAPADGRVGIILGARQTLLTTFLLYQELAWMGRSAGAMLAALNCADPLVRADPVGRALGGIEVSVRSAGGAWLPVGEVGETGPIATDVFVIPLDVPPADSVQVRLRLTRGHWRLDYVALATLTGRVAAERLKPQGVFREGVPDTEALERLVDPKRVLTTIRGDRYTLVYQLPENFEDAELFLESRGYYLEWIRDEWLAEEDPARAIALLLDPARTLRELAPKFARGEREREAVFWGSRYAHP